jgi:VanZ family protein
LMAAIFVISSRPAPEIVQHEYIRFQDKWLHIVAYLVLSCLFLRALVWEGTGWGLNAFFLAFLLSAVYGASDEWHQYYVPERESDWVDWVADALGAGLAVFLWVPLKWLYAWELGWLRKRLPSIVPEGSYEK